MLTKLRTYNDNNNYFILVSMSSSAFATIGDTFQASIGIWKCWFLRRGDNRSTRRKTSRSREETQQQTKPTYDAGSGNRTRDTLVGGERSHHCTIPLLRPPTKKIRHNLKARKQCHAPAICILHSKQMVHPLDDMRRSQY